METDTHSFLSLMQLFISCLLCFIAKAERSSNNVSVSVSASASALYVFGDSTVDPGNNNYMDTPLKSNFPPYGRDFPNQVASGRFTNGKLTTDYIASYAGLKKEFLPPYLDPKLDMKELMTGVSFASAGSGFDPLTPILSELWEEGAREIAVAGLPPLGCLPIMIRLNSFEERRCMDRYPAIARDYNQMLQHELQLMQHDLGNPGANIYYVDIYGPLADMIQAHDKYGFEEVDNGCCGSGYIETSFLCNDISPLCPDASKYVFWDSLHPTDKAYHNIFLAARSTVDSIIDHIQHNHHI